MAKIESGTYVFEEYLNLDDASMLKPLLRLTIKKGEKFFGPGVATLLHLVDEKGSIQAACGTMEMSYSKAWKIVKRAEKELGFDLFLSQNGGVKGGNSTLTDRGKEFLERYDYVVAKLKEEAKKLFYDNFSEYF